MVTKPYTLQSLTTFPWENLTYLGLIFQAFFLLNSRILLSAHQQYINQNSDHFEELVNHFEEICGKNPE